MRNSWNIAHWSSIFWFKYSIQSGLQLYFCLYSEHCSKCGSPHWSRQTMSGRRIWTRQRSSSSRSQNQSELCAATGRSPQKLWVLKHALQSWKLANVSSVFDYILSIISPWYGLRTSYLQWNTLWKLHVGLPGGLHEKTDKIRACSAHMMVATGRLTR